MKRSTESLPDERWEAGESSMLDFVRRLGERVAMRSRRADAPVVFHHVVVIDRIRG
jgi:hypothetical protein